MMRSAVLVAMLGLSMAACAGDEESDASVFAVDTDSSGEVDCADLEHVTVCLAHPDAEDCAHADVNGDGVVDEADVHDIYDGLHATGHACEEPEGHHDDGASHDGTPH